MADSGRQFEHTVETTYYNVTTSITPYTTYNLAVAARTVNGTGPFSNMTTARTLQDGMKQLNADDFVQSNRSLKFRQ